MSKGRFVLTAAVVAALWLGAGEAAAQQGPAGGKTFQGAEPGRVALVYKLGKNTLGCDDETTFRRWVAGKMQRRDPFVVEGPALHALDVRIERDPPGFRAVAELRDAQGNVVLARDSLHRTCDEAVDRMVVAVLLSVFPPPPAAAPPAPQCGPCSEAERAEREKMQRKLDGLQRQLDELAHENEARKAEQARVEKALQDLKDTGYVRAMDLTYALSTGLLVTANLTSNAGPGVWLGGEVRSGPLTLGLEVRAVLPAPVFLGPHDFDFSEVGGLLTPCGRYSYFFGCAVMGAGVEVEQDSNPVGFKAFGAVFPLLQLGGRVGVEAPFAQNRFAVRAWAEVLYSAPPIFATYKGTGLTWDRPDVSAFFGAGFVVKFGNEITR
jgi:hypothetical protein